MGRAPCCDKSKVKKGPWSPEEDAKLKSYVDQHGTGGNWITLPIKAGLNRCGKSCRLRWINYLRPGIKRGGFSKEEEDLIFKLHASVGSRWSLIALQLPGRTDNDIKNFWNTRLKRKLISSSKQQAGQLSPACIQLQFPGDRLSEELLGSILPPTVPSLAKPQFSHQNELLIQNQLLVEEMLQRIESSLRSCISVNTADQASWQQLDYYSRNAYSKIY